MVLESEQATQGALNEQLAAFAGTFSDAELRSPPQWGGTVYRWAGREGFDPAAAWNAFPAVAEVELARRERIAAACGMLFEGRWPITLDIELRSCAG